MTGNKLSVIVNVILFYVFELSLKLLFIYYFSTIPETELSMSLKDSDFIGIFYCFSNFGTILIKRFRFYRNLLLFFEFRYYPYYYYYYYYRPRYYLGLFCFCYCYTLLFIYLFIIPSNRDPLPHCISKTNNNITIKFLVHTQQCPTTCRRKNSVTFTDDLDP